ncbi:MAG: flagellar type III secretion system pore protein FliP [Pseudomonadota bacterium]
MRRLSSAVLAGLAAAVLMADIASAQSITIDLGTGAAEAEQDPASTPDATLTGRIIQLFLAVTVLSLAPGIAMMVTCFPFMVTVLSILRQGIGLQSAPPNMLMISLALFLTFFVMEPVLVEIWDGAISPLMDGRLSPEAAFAAAEPPLRAFMEGRTDPATVIELAAAAPGRAVPGPGEPAPLGLLIPAFMLSEIARAFTVGFMLFLPFVVIDLVVASVLMSMGMMMVPPIVVSLPLKLAFFVIADGWTLVAGALVRGYG